MTNQAQSAEERIANIRADIELLGHRSPYAPAGALGFLLAQLDEAQKAYKVVVNLSIELGQTQARNQRLVALIHDLKADLEEAEGDMIDERWGGTIARAAQELRGE